MQGEETDPSAPIWRDMGTAPLDGTDVLIWDGLEVVVGSYYKRPTFAEWENVVGEGITEAQYEDDMLHEPVEGWYGREIVSGDQLFLTPLMWQPKPQPPAAAPSSTADGRTG